MTALELITGAADLLFAVMFVVAAIDARRQRTRASIDILLFFGGLAFAVLLTPSLALIGLTTGVVLSTALSIVVVALPYLLVRLLADFTRVPLLVRAATAGGFLASVIFVVVLAGRPLPVQVAVAIVGYFAAATLYAAFGFARLSRRSSGVTRRRTDAVAAGNALLGFAIVIAGIGLVASLPPGATGGIVELMILAAAVSWLFGFAPPPQLRRYWQEPELRKFLERASTLPRLPSTDAILRELERGIGESFGARAAVGLVDMSAGVIRFDRGHGALPSEVPLESDYLAARVFRSQRAAFFADAAAAHPAHADAYRTAHVGPAIVAPITAGDRRIGVLEAFAEQRPVFSDDDVALAELLADQAAVVLESRALIDEAARVRAQEQATRLKEDFVSAAAHDLKTPLTTLMGQAQILELRFRRDPGLATHLPGIERIGREARRLSALVEDLLDASRIEQGRLDVRREPCDVAVVLREVASRPRPEAARLAVDVQGALAGSFDRRRIDQLVENLVENGLKYSPADATVELRGWREDGAVRISVRDHGIGIPPDDVPHVFDRFHRASNVEARRYAGIGLGLYICRGIAEEHGGRIWVESTVGQGSTFHVLLPVTADGAERRLN